MARIAINGFGRMGRLFLRAASSRNELQVVAVNEPKGDAATVALLLEFRMVDLARSIAAGLCG